jgi:drug/metabolite transporter (DMT)-like permease
VILYGGYSVGLKWKPVMHWQSLLAVPCIGAALTCIPFILWRHVTHPFGWPDATGWAVVVYASVFVALISTATYIAGVARIGPNRAGLFINLLPIFGVALSVILLGEPVHRFHILSLGLVCGGIILSEWKRFRRVPESKTGNAGIGLA